jgi:molybdate transport system ATP-binding protein
VTHNFDEVWRLATHVVLLESGTVVAQGSIDAMSLDPRLRSIIGPDEIGAVVEGTVLGIDPTSRLTRVRVGRGELNVQMRDVPAGTALRVQLLARDLIVSTRVPEHLSVRNSLHGVVVDVQADADSDLITIDVGATVLARVTHAATRELGLRAGLPVWALVKSVSLRGRSVTSPVFQDA